MIRTALVTLLSLALPSTASATWSIIAVDLSTGRVVIASATCVNRDDQFLKGVQAVVVPGKGVAACQASVDGTHANQMLVFEELKKGTDPDAHHRAAECRSGIPVASVRHPRSSGTKRRPLRPHERLRLAGHSRPRAGHADLLLDSGQHPPARSGRAERRESVPRQQGRDHGPRDGGDGRGRQLRRRQPLHVSAAAADGATPAIPCEGKTAHVAYILMAETTDTNGDSHNNGTTRCTSPSRNPARTPALA